MTTMAEINNHLAALECFMVVQRDHLTVLEKGAVGDFNEWRCARQEVFAKLRKSLSGPELAGVTGADRDVLLAKFQELMALEEALFAAAQQQKSKLADDIGAMRKGRKALHGYGAKSSSGPQPRFLSSRM